MVKSNTIFIDKTSSFELKNWEDDDVKKAIELLDLYFNRSAVPKNWTLETKNKPIKINSYKGLVYLEVKDHPEILLKQNDKLLRYKKIARDCFCLSNNQLN